MQQPVTLAVCLAHTHVDALPSIFVSAPPFPSRLSFFLPLLNPTPSLPYFATQRTHLPVGRWRP